MAAEDIVGRVGSGWRNFHSSNFIMPILYSILATVFLGLCVIAGLIVFAIFRMAADDDLGAERDAMRNNFPQPTSKRVESNRDENPALIINAKPVPPCGNGALAGE